MLTTHRYVSEIADSSGSKKGKKKTFPADLFKVPGTRQVSCMQVDDHQLAGAWWPASKSTEEFAAPWRTL
jgi:hypothetical protein